MNLSKDYNVLFFGINGWIGNKVYKLLQNKNINIYVAKSRADDYISVESEIKNIKCITHIV
jgi:hypothetical protein